MNQMTTTQPHAVADLEKMSRAIAGSGLFGVRKPEEAFALMLVAQAEGRHPATIAQDYDIIQGRPALKSIAALSRFQASGGRIQWTERGPAACAAEFSHPSGGSLVIRWDIARAQAAGLTGKDNWKKFPDQMLAARVVAEGVRAVFPACLSGLYLAEEVQDFEPRRAAPEAVPHVELADAAKLATLLGAARAAGLTEGEIVQALGCKPADATVEDAARLADRVREARATKAAPVEPVQVAEEATCDAQ